MANHHFYDQIVVTGSIAYDEIMDFPDCFVNYFNPNKLHQINISFVVNKLEKQMGGTGTNIAYNLSLLIDKKIKLLAGIGKDGNNFLKFFKKHRIDIDGIIIDRNFYTATGKVITDKKDNQIWGFYNGAGVRGGDINLAKFTTVKSLIIISANHPRAFLNFQKTVIKLKLDYLYDPGMVLTWINEKDLQTGILNCRFLVGNDYEIDKILLNSNLKKTQLLKKNIAIITTVGEKGVNYEDKKHKFFISGYKVRKIIDPTGAGDAWRAGFIAGIIKGKTIKESLKLGNALASFAVEKYGTVNHKPTKKEIEKRVKSL